MTFWETVLCAILASLFAVVLSILRTAGVFRKKNPKEPPLDKGLIPWLGHGISFQKKPLIFVEEMRKKHGDIFTILVGGIYINVVTDPHAYEDLMKEPKEKLDFNTVALQIVNNVFGFRPTEQQHKIVGNNSKKYLKGKNLASLNLAMLKKLDLVLLYGQGSSEKKRSWQQDGLYRFSFKTLFHASYLALFGTEPEKEVGEKAKEHQAHCDELFEAFQKFDKFFPQMAFGILDRSGQKEAQTLKEYFWDQLLVEKICCKDGISNWITEQVQLMAVAGMKGKMQTRLLLLLLWASQANVGPAAFWILAHLLKHPEAMKAVREEVEKALREVDQEVKPGGPFIEVSLDMIKTPLLDSAVEETLRLVAGSFVFRSVMQDTDLKMSDGREYTLRKGDQLLLIPYVGLHTDPEIYPDPFTFKYDRFLNPDGTKKEFYKNGKKLKYNIMPFGAGATMCPGRFFAISEMKMFVIVMLTYFEMELANVEEDIPPLDGSRCGFGTSHPAHDIQFRYRLRF